MNESRKVQSHNLERDAYLYIRQSSMKQVIENVESTSGSTPFALARLRSAGPTIGSSSSTPIRESRVHRQPGGKAFGGW